MDTPISPSGKKEKVREMFDGIAYRYDFLNHLLSLGTDILWRNKVLRLARKMKPLEILDVATGTGDLAITLSKCRPVSITGIDISEGMLQVGRKKINDKALSNLINLQPGDSENLQFPDSHFDLVTAAFGVRNFEDLSRGLSEMNRVLKQNGNILILEFSTITNPFWKVLFTFYFKWMLPLIGRMVSKHDFAYRYLPESVGIFPYGKEFLGLLQQAGFQNTRQYRLTGGIATIYTGQRK
ncbi:MAG: bifunctional demethylmenaquinone methyltransferase/2-methoxy-6-polyprenyl-1,4-benzoquinol methylase UbiE [Bacteroidetes bacterium]|nr:bifunctional demethylmenaquinone methyltransferase/2-methoxy-6-polyprenyl-1,4-benzoquinol methylase UbiE [Bacteroidota bacterium]